MTKHESGRGITTEVREMTKGLKRVGLGLVAVGLSLMLLLTGAMPSHAVPAEKTAKVALFSYITGPICTVGLPCHRAIVDYFKYINEEKGGINGVEIDWSWEDLGARPYLAQVTAYKRAKEAGAVLMYSQSSAMEVIAPLAQRDKMPFQGITMVARGITNPDRWLFGSGPGVGPGIATFVKWVTENWTEDRPPRFAVFTYDAAQGRDLLDGVQWACQQLGLEPPHVEIVPYMTVLDTSTEVLRLIRAKPDWICTIHYGSNFCVMMKDMARLEVQERGIKICAGEGGTDEYVLAMAGGAAEGWYGANPMPSYAETQFWGVKLANELAKKYRGWGPEKCSIFYQTGYSNAAAMVEWLRRAIEKVGLENLTPSAVRDAAVSGEEFDIGWGAPARMTNEWPVYFPYIRIHHVEGGKNMPVTDLFPAWIVVGGPGDHPFK